MNVYKFGINGLCPVDGTHDRYEVTVKSRKTIKAELLTEVIERWSGSVLFQEAITKRIRRDLEVADGTCLAFGPTVNAPRVAQWMDRQWANPQLTL